MWVIAGLGNPGSSYRFTRHNVGFLVLDELAARQRIRWKERKNVAFLGSGSVSGEEVLLIKPQTYMNNSGQVVAPMMRKKGRPAESLIVVHDDLDLPFGRLKIREGGGAGGHKGILSIQQMLGAKEFLRVKIGIGRPPAEQPSENYVLSRFRKDEVEPLQALLERGAEAVECILREGTERAMNRFHRRDSMDALSDSAENG